ncbi:capsule assembly Wzi family protein [Pigmentiphaga kullae]|uniref:Capsule assembly protein Wzi n=1 Tax=Pigmentiphaga kullae TaxID=151784 RepID=A0A4Q7NLM5_9BURK|nr:capsule assembly Wzi family protein [Pigmentiphaga kullae]RZS85963.1 capsule assembly protein Wzi [Pigmentiphaga kullae]
MIEAGNQELRDDVQWLVDRGIIGYVSTSTWPIPVSALESALEVRKKKGLTRADVHAILAVRRYLDDQKSFNFGVTTQINTDSVPQLGFANQSRAVVTGGVYLRGGNETFAGKLQLNGLLDPLTSKQSKANVEGSYVSARFLGQALYVGQLAHYWGPGVDGSLNWGNAGTAIPGIGLQRAKQSAPQSKWLSWIGPWGYDIFLGQLQHDTAVPDARVMNMRLFFRPFVGLELGASRFIEWGGSGKNNGFNAIWNALKGNSNNLANDPSNELSGVDFRYTINARGNPLTIYGQLAGEDEAGGMPSHFLAQMGMQFKHAIGSTRLHWYAEAADTTARRVFGLGQGMIGTAYRHSTYSNGLYHDGMPIGYPIGGSGRLVSAGVTVIPDDFRYFSRYKFRILQAEVNEASQKINQVFPDSARWYGAELSYSWRLRPVNLKAGLVVLRRTAGKFDNTFSVLLGMDIPLSGF